MTRIMLLGMDGQLGFAISQADWFSHEGLAFGRSDCDLADEAALRNIVRETKPDILINAAAYTAVDRAEDEPDLAHTINTRAPAILADEARSCDAVLMHYSTDYVFDGAGTVPYAETDSVGPVSVYGRTKLAGEQAVAASGCRHVIIRTSWVYGAHGQNFAKTMLQLGQERQTLSIVADQWGTPTSVDLLCEVTAKFVERIVANPAIDDPLWGLYHCASAGRTNWRDYAVTFLSCCLQAGFILKLDPETIAPIPSSAYPTKAQRPNNSLLSCVKLEQTLGMTLPDWQVGLERLAIDLADTLIQDSAN